MMETTAELDYNTIDAHQHFWKFDAVRDSWIDDSMKVIQADFMPDDLQPLLKQNGIDGCVVVQSSQAEAENDFQLANAAQYPFIKGVVGWVDLQAENLEERLEHYSLFPNLKGFRHVLQGEPVRDLMLQPKFLDGFRLLQQYNFTYDLLIFPDQLKFATTLVQKFPAQKFVLDHIAKPSIKSGSIDEWQKDIVELGRNTNVFCKISGLVTEADWHNWKPGDFTPYLDVIVQAFGTERIMYGSDWPVCLVAASYQQTLNIVQEYFSSFSQHEQSLFFGLNATQFYQL